MLGRVLKELIPSNNWFKDSTASRLGLPTKSLDKASSSFFLEIILDTTRNSVGDWDRSTELGRVRLEEIKGGCAKTEEGGGGGRIENDYWDSGEEETSFLSTTIKP